LPRPLLRQTANNYHKKQSKWITSSGQGGERGSCPEGKYTCQLRLNEQTDREEREQNAHIG
jgi:RAB protein geranylgeranyltransferase component A